MEQRLKHTTDSFKYFEALGFHRKILLIPWIWKLTNNVVLKRRHEIWHIVEDMNKRKICYFENIIRGSKYKLLKLIIQGNAECRKNLENRKITWLQNISISSKRSILIFSLLEKKSVVVSSLCFSFSVKFKPILRRI